MVFKQKNWRKKNVNGTRDPRPLQMPLKNSILYFEPFPFRECVCQKFWWLQFLCAKGEPKEFSIYTIAIVWGWHCETSHRGMVCVATTCIFRDCPTDRLSVWRILPRPSLLLSSYQHQPPGSFVYLSAFLATTLNKHRYTLDITSKILRSEFVKHSKSCLKEELF